MLLALDSATRQAGLALYDGEVVRAEANWSGGLYHTEWLAPTIDDALKRINARAADLSAVAVTRGPGSFTGLRVAMSLGKGIAAAHSLPIIGISSLDVTAYPHVGLGHAVLALLQAGRGRHAYAIYEPGGTHSALSATEPTIADIEGVAQRLAAYEAESRVHVVGELTPAERRYLEEKMEEEIRLLPPALAVRRPAALAELAWHRFKAGDVDDLHTLEPFYLNLPASKHS
ncbi:MAG: tRNA (adenosine(37)-N6)-threonylcarbamoyltransferase complex dimerization subunit type 1 TsaB [Chloroflexota bacterium]|nr:tRNA (adenosine(37)-N6)-threonylcarbamoyltransferase complex dimerization subunit type 1 TsaB [Chloroflexota bacterium]